MSTPSTSVPNPLLLSDTLPEALQKFIKDSRVHPDNYSLSSLNVPRFIRLAPARLGRPKVSLEELLAQLPSDIALTATAVPDVYSLPRATTIASLPL